MSTVLFYSSVVLELCGRSIGLKSYAHITFHPTNFVSPRAKSWHADKFKYPVWFLCEIMYESHSHLLPTADNNFTVVTISFHVTNLSLFKCRGHVSAVGRRSIPCSIWWCYLIVISIARSFIPEFNSMQQNLKTVSWLGNWSLYIFS